MLDGSLYEEAWYYSRLMLSLNKIFSKLRKNKTKKNGKASPPQRDPLIIPRPDHTISRSQISSAALKVLYGLKEAGYDAYLVGGCVRDLLLGHEPKDFDVATNASNSGWSGYMAIMTDAFAENPLIIGLPPPS